jgi:hypothetical protein
VTVTAAGGCTTVDEGGSWTVTMTSGTIDCVLTASQPGDGNFDPAESVIRTVAASRTWQDNMAILGPDSATYGDTFPVLVTGGTGDGQVTFAADGDGCTVVQSGDGSADVTMTTGSGTCYLVATIAADANYLENSRTLSIDATPATLNIDAGTVSKVAGANDPAMAWSLSGFVNGDTTAATLVSGAPNCQREVGETPGTYDALCYPASMSADNYTFGFGAFGSLTITARSAPTQTVAATAGTSTTIDALAPLGAGFVVASFDARSANGATITTAAGTFTYTAPTEFVGTDSFSYTVTDQFGNQTVVTVSIQVAAAGIAPLAVPAPTPQPAPTTPVLAPPTGQLPATGGDYATLLLTAVFALLVGFGLHIARRPS